MLSTFISRAKIDTSYIVYPLVFIVFTIYSYILCFDAVLSFLDTL